MFIAPIVHEKPMNANLSFEGFNTAHPSVPSIILETEQLSVSYRGVVAIRNMNLKIMRHQTTSLIGPSGCGKSTLLRCFNRMNELIPGTVTEGTVRLNEQPLHQIPAIEVRRRIGMVFQRPNPFPQSVYENLAVGLRVNGYRGDIDLRVEQALRQTNLWDEVKDKLRSNALELSGGQQQRLCIARAIALNPEVLLMDEPCSALDPIATLKIEELIQSLKSTVTTVIVTHNMQQASRISDYTAFLSIDPHRAGHLVEYAPTYQLFCAPTDERTRNYIARRFE